jgi:hypothetical protein
MALSLAATTPNPNQHLNVLRKNVNVARIFQIVDAGCNLFDLATQRRELRIALGRQTATFADQPVHRGAANRATDRSGARGQHREIEHHAPNIVPDDPVTYERHVGFVFAG